MGVPPYLQYLYVMRSGGGNAAEQAYIDRVEADGGKIVKIGCVPDAIWDRPTSTFVGALDSYPADAAYSVYRLFSSYEGYLLRVRRSSDSTEQDVGYDTDGYLDTASLLSFVGANDGFTPDTYDQSGSNDLEQGTASAQPQIVSSGTLVEDNSKAALELNGSSQYLTPQSTITLSNEFSVHLIMNLDVNSYIFGDTVGGDYLRYRINDSLRIRIGGTTLTVTGVGDITGQQVLLTIQRNSSNTIDFFVNGSSVGSGTLAGSWDIAEVGSYVTNYLDGKTQCLVIYDSDQSANRTSIETALNNLFSIY